jgi:[acyl-carrier-protein] S-malonyltransferase
MFPFLGNISKCVIIETSQGESMDNYAFLFPGQGSQAVEMGKDLFEKTEFGRKTFQLADEILGYRLSKICFEGPEEELKLTHNGQPALLAVSYILFNLLGKAPVIAAGHSLGEYSALLCAGAFRFEDAVLLVHKRGKYMQEAVPVGRGAMAAIMGGDIDEIKQVVSGVQGSVNVANFNSSSQVVISGDRQAVEAAVEEIQAKKVKFLPVSAPFHSELMLPAEEKLSKDLDQIEFKDLKFPVVNNIAVAEMTKAEEARESLRKQVTRPVYWHDTMVKLLEEKGILNFAEVGTGKVLTNIVKRTARELQREVTIVNIRNLEEVHQVTMN